MDDINMDEEGDPELSVSEDDDHEDEFQPITEEARVASYRAAKYEAAWLRIRNIPISGEGAPELIDIHGSSNRTHWYTTIRMLEYWFMASGIPFDRYVSDTMTIVNAALASKDWAMGLGVFCLHRLTFVRELGRNMTTADRIPRSITSTPVQKMRRHALKFVLWAYAHEKESVTLATIETLLRYLSTVSRDRRAYIFADLFTGDLWFDFCEHWTEERMLKPFIMLKSYLGTVADFGFRPLDEIVSGASNSWDQANYRLPVWMSAILVYWLFGEEDKDSVLVQRVLCGFTTNRSLTTEGIEQNMQSDAMRTSPVQNIEWYYLVALRELCPTLSRRLDVARKLLENEKWRRLAKYYTEADKRKRSLGGQPPKTEREYEKEELDMLVGNKSDYNRRRSEIEQTDLPVSFDTQLDTQLFQLCDGERTLLYWQAQDSCPNPAIGLTDFTDLLATIDNHFADKGNIEANILLTTVAVCFERVLQLSASLLDLRLAMTDIDVLLELVECMSFVGFGPSRFADMPTTAIKGAVRVAQMRINPTKFAHAHREAPLEAQLARKLGPHILAKVNSFLLADPSSVERGKELERLLHVQAKHLAEKHISIAQKVADAARHESGVHQAREQ